MDQNKKQLPPYPLYIFNRKANRLIKTAQAVARKIGKGQARTSTIQIIAIDTLQVKKQFRFNLFDAASYGKAYDKALAWAKDHDLTK